MVLVKFFIKFISIEKCGRNIVSNIVVRMKVIFIVVVYGFNLFLLLKYGV